MLTSINSAVRKVVGVVAVITLLFITGCNNKSAEIKKLEKDFDRQIKPIHDFMVFSGLNFAVGTFLITDPGFFEEHKNRPVKFAELNKEIMPKWRVKKLEGNASVIPVIFFENPPLNKDGEAQVTVQFSLLHPRGDVLYKTNEVKLTGKKFKKNHFYWAPRFPAMQVPPANAWKRGKHDGEYSIEVQVTDQVEQRKFTLKQKFYLTI